MSKKDTGDISPNDKGFNRKANSILPSGMRGSGTGAKYESMMDSYQEHALKRTASGDGGMGGFTDSGGSSRVPIMYVDPMFDPILLMFPKENLKELNRRLRHYYSFHPIIRNLINLHSTFPFGDMEIRCEDKALEPYWQDLGDRLNLMQMIVQMSRDYELLGESFHVGNWDDNTLEWEAFHQYPPENIEVHKVYAGSGIAYFLKPDEELRKMMNSSKEIDRAVVEMLPPDFKERVSQGKPIHLDNSRVIHYANKSAGYLTRGESPMKAALKYLLAEDKLYMLMLTFIDRHMFPIKIWKIGSKEQKWLPSKKHFDMLKAKLIEAKGDPDYDLIYHAFLDMEYKTGVDKHEDLIKWFDWTQKRILIALFANEAMFAEANPYAKEAMSIKLIMHRYMLQRSLVNREVSGKVWLPVAKKRGYELRTQSEAAANVANDKSYVPDIRKYAIPKLFWRPSNLVAGMQEQEYLAKMRKEGDLPVEAIYDLLGFDTDKMKAAIENEQATALDPVWREARKKLIEDPVARNETLRGRKLKDIELPRDIVDPKKPAGRPAVAPGDKAIPPGSGAAPGMVPNSVVPPREKQQERGVLPAPAGEPGPTMPEV